MEAVREYENAIEIKNLWKQYDNFELQHIDFVVPKGCIMGFVGQNGAGKTTTIRSILNMISIDDGEIHILGYDNRQEERMAKEDIGVVFDEIGFHKVLTPIQINKMFRNIYHNWEEDTFFAYLDRFGLPKKKPIGKFSRGMQMKLQIAVALSHQSRLLIMDEPTSGLDPIVRNEILDVFLSYVENEEHTILLSSHIISDLERVADYITFIDRGRILLSDERLRILENHRLIKCGREDIEQLPADLIVGERISQFGAEVLLRTSEAWERLPSEFLIEQAGLEEIMLFYVAGIQQGQKQVGR